MLWPRIAETANVISNNVVMLARESIAMLNTELTPASFHFANLNNIADGNAASERLFRGLGFGTTAGRGGSELGGVA